MTVAIGPKNGLESAWQKSVADAINNGTQVATGTYTPTLTNITLGTGGSPTNTAEYTFIGGPNVGDKGLLSIDGNIVLGTSGMAMGSNPAVSLPSGFNGIFTSGHWIGLIRLGDSSAGTRNSGTLQAGAATFSSIGMVYDSVSGSLLVKTGITATTPFTWAASDFITWSLIVPAVRV